MSSSGLPTHLFETYAFYKQNTSSFIRWLSVHNKDAKERTSINSVKELMALANSVIAKQVTVPVELFHNLGKTIRARTRVSRFFRNAGKNEELEALSSHEYFTRALQQIHGDLRELMAKSRNSTSPIDEHFVIENTNPFECLHWEECLKDKEEAQPIERKHISSSRITGETCCPNHHRATEKDDIGEFMAIALYLSVGSFHPRNQDHTYSCIRQELDQLGITVKKSWQRAAVGQIPVVLAASTTSLACKCACGVEHHLAEYGIHHPDHLFERYSSCMHSLNIAGSFFKTPDATLEKGLKQTWLILKDFKKFWGTPGAQEKLRNLDNRQFRHSSRPGPFPFDDPKEFVASDDFGSQAEANRDYLTVILKRMGQLIVQTSNWLSKPLERLPVFEQFAGFMLDKENIRVLGLNFGLQMLVESTTCYLKALSMEKNAVECSQHKSSNGCRVQSLRFTSDVKCNIERTMAIPLALCGCFKIESRSIEALVLWWQEILDNFAYTKRFDLFYQAPWTSGCHMARTLMKASFLGSQVWHYGYYVGTVLHMYHSLVALGFLNPDEIPLFENLCNIFERQLFLDKRPYRNISSCYQRWVGSVIEFPKERCHSMHSHADGSTSNGDKKWKMKHIRDKSQGGDNPLRNYNPCKVSLFSFLETEKYIMHDKVLAWVYCSKNCEKIREKDIKEARKKAEAEPFVARSVELIQEALLKEFEGEFPVARINYFAVYRVCLQLLRAVNVAEHPQDGPEKVCGCASVRLFRFADEHIENGPFINLCSDRLLVKNCRDTMLSVMENKPLTDFLWQV